MKMRHRRRNRPTRQEPRRGFFDLRPYQRIMMADLSKLELRIVASLPDPAFHYRGATTGRVAINTPRLQDFPHEP